jgi:hypothetical protein
MQGTRDGTVPIRPAGHAKRAVLSGIFVALGTEARCLEICVEWSYAVLEDFVSCHVKASPDTCRRLRSLLTWLAFAGLGIAAGAAPSVATAAQDAAAPGPVKLSLQLNKLEPHDQSCRAYMVITNKTDTPYDSFKLDLIEFGTDGIIGHRFAIDLGPIRANKEMVKLFDIQTPCDQIGSFLVNDVLECKTASGPAKDCLSGLALSSRAKAQLTK